MAIGESKILKRMLERLYAAIANGPSLNCRPRSSRQRMDFMWLERLGDVTPPVALASLLGPDAACTLTGRQQPPPTAIANGMRRHSNHEPRDEITAWSAQKDIFRRLRILADDARTYEQDTGVYVLSLGFPLLSLPPGAGHSGGSLSSPGRRILAPLAFVPVSVSVSNEALGSPRVEIRCVEDEVDRVHPNEALLAWLEQQTGKTHRGPLDTAAADPFSEIAEIISAIAAMTGIGPPPWALELQTTRTVPLSAAPAAQDDEVSTRIVCAAVLGLFPAANQGTLRDMKAMLDGEPLTGQVDRFLRADGAILTTSAPALEADKGVRAQTTPVNLILPADPCQAAAVAATATSPMLVIHGPPGTGKSQTIANIISDHLCRGERVLFVCDKRTALDVVANRLTAAGLADLCAVVHDPQRDQRSLYMSIRAQLDRLTEAQPDDDAKARLSAIDRAVQEHRTQLDRAYTALHEAPSGERSLHDLTAEWLATPRDSGAVLDGADNDEPPLDDDLKKALNDPALPEALPSIEGACRRAGACGYATNVWSTCAAMPLADFLAQPAGERRKVLSMIAAAARACDDGRTPDLPYGPEDLTLQIDARRTLIRRLTHLETVPLDVRRRWVHAAPDLIRRAVKVLVDLKDLIHELQTTRADPAAQAASAALPAHTGPLSRMVSDLDAYLHKSGVWYGFLLFGRAGPARAATAALGLSLNPQNALVARKVIGLRRDCVAVQGALVNLGISECPSTDPEAVASTAELHRHVVEALHGAFGAGGIAVQTRCADAICGNLPAEPFLRSLSASIQWGELLLKLQELETASGLLEGAWLTRTHQSRREGAPCAPVADQLENDAGSLEEVLRVREVMQKLPKALENCITTRLRLVGADSAMSFLRRTMLTEAISRRLRTTPSARDFDGAGLTDSLKQIPLLAKSRQEFVGRDVLSRWRRLQCERLLVGTGSRLNSLGAEVRRRLMVKGERALRLRQVIALGESIEGGDPLLDLRPVWMASPETVAQVFPRREMFDIVIFDEASQCRLEEALPVLLRAKRIAVAGDPRQLPPTRFFESTAATGDMDEIETEQDLFEHQQAEVEDLLGAALNLDVDQAYLDVHYRSTSAGLIGFSNEHFYQQRLQPIPSHPSREPRECPITLVHVGGVYESRVNPAEAARIVDLVAELLNSDHPPSIGIACFNVAQRDTITDALDERAAADPEFGERLSQARSRTNSGGFEGLFVKNLESVQGDERDHMIVSTTYGPDATGRFYRRFGPLGLPGGGRRLNVLVTRARSRMHVFTSIPPEIYRSIPPVPPDQEKGGGWLLLAYLQHAERLKESGAARPAEGKTHTGPASAHLRIESTPNPSELAIALAGRLTAERSLDTVVHWGNPGFCVDVALKSPSQIATDFRGLACDFARYRAAGDPVAWDAFAFDLLQRQGWRIRRTWSPNLFRDIAQAAAAAIAD